MIIPETPTAPSSPHEALDRLRARIVTVEREPVALPRAIGRVLAEDLRADRASPACDVSAMDGFAVRAEDLASGTLAIAAEVRIGQAPPALAPGSAVRIVTGGAVPEGADTIVRREDVREEGGVIVIEAGTAARILPGAEIRREGENGRMGDPVVSSGTLLDATNASALASFGGSVIQVHRRVRVALLTTGDELVDPGAPATRWQVRDSNGLALRALLDRPWIELLSFPRAPDEPDAMRAAITAALSSADALVLTGGVSMGARDHVPDALRACGVEVLFHRLPQRPGRPVLGAIAPGGRPVLALPGNPVSVQVTGRRLALPAIARRAGITRDRARIAVCLHPALPDSGALWWHRLVRIAPDGTASIVPSSGSGDVVAIAKSDGFVEIPPRTAGAGPFPFYEWA